VTIVTGIPHVISELCIMNLRTTLLLAAGALIGALAGWLYWYYVGCAEGCAITSSPVNSSLYGALMGGLLVSSFRKEQGTSGTN
jgi:hypothetical protein